MAAGKPRQPWYYRSPFDPEKLGAKSPGGVDVRSPRGAHRHGGRIGGWAFRQALADPEVRGDCDAIRAAALRYAEAYLATDPPLLQLRDLPQSKRKDRMRTDEWLEAVDANARTGVQDVVASRWMKMGCREGKQMLMLPRGFGRMRRQRRLRLRLW